eukprot:TRINITY_DN6122_c0_g1_i1.p1 TRINITY_DN6122_c0_g1~~TRINITY_DN6122_c0_g1_i1.p1  ORF type:complete len:3333 (-),score=563.37 TRINITY_DN6122_c0_g1_i1:30-10028(-)
MMLFLVFSALLSVSSQEVAVGEGNSSMSEVPKEWNGSMSEVPKESDGSMPEGAKAGAAASCYSTPYMESMDDMIGTKSRRLTESKVPTEVNVSKVPGQELTPEAWKPIVCERWAKEQLEKNCKDDDAKLMRECRRQADVCDTSILKGGCSGDKVPQLCYSGADKLQKIVQEGCPETCEVCPMLKDGIQPTGCCTVTVNGMMQTKGTTDMTQCQSFGGNFMFNVKCEDIPCEDDDDTVRAACESNPDCPEGYFADGCQSEPIKAWCNSDNSGARDFARSNCPEMCGICAYMRGEAKRGCCFEQSWSENTMGSNMGYSRTMCSDVPVFDCPLLKDSSTSALHEMLASKGQKLIYTAHATCDALRTDSCKTSSWPSLKENLVCAPCMGLIRDFWRYRSCDKYCGMLGRMCKSSGLVDSNPCQIREPVKCDEERGDGEMMCECGEEISLKPLCNVTMSATGLETGHLLGCGLTGCSAQSASSWEEAKAGDLCSSYLSKLGCSSKIGEACAAEVGTTGAASLLTVQDVCLKECNSTCTADVLAPGGDVHQCIMTKRANLETAAEDLWGNYQATMPGVCLAFQEFLDCMPSSCCGVNEQVAKMFSSASKDSIVIGSVLANCSKFKYPCAYSLPASEPCKLMCEDGANFLPDARTKFYDNGKFELTCGETLKTLQTEHQCRTWDKHLWQNLEYDCCPRPPVIYNRSKCKDSCWYHESHERSPLCEDNWTVVKIPDGRKGYSDGREFNCKTPTMEPDAVPPAEYYVYTDGKTWMQAQEHCESQGLKLATFCTMTELIMGMSTEERPWEFWIGLQDKGEENWAWVDDRVCDDWRPWFKNEWEKHPMTDDWHNCAAATRENDGKFRSKNCFEEKAYVCMGNFTEWLMKKYTCPLGYTVCQKCCDLSGSCRCDEEWQCDSPHERLTNRRCSISHDWATRADASACVNEFWNETLDCCAANATCNGSFVSVATGDASYHSDSTYLGLFGEKCASSDQHKLYCLKTYTPDDNHFCASDQDYTPEKSIGERCELREENLSAIDRQTCCENGGSMKRHHLEDGTVAYRCRLEDFAVEEDKVNVCKKLGGNVYNESRCRDRGPRLQPGATLTPETCAAPRSEIVMGSLREQDGSAVGAEYTRSGQVEECCSGKPGLCEVSPPVTGMCKNPSEWLGDKTLSVLCYNLNKVDCCALRGDWSETEDWRKNDDQCLMEASWDAGKCQLTTERLGADDDLMKLCTDKGGFPREVYTCDSLAWSGRVEHEIKDYLYGMKKIVNGTCSTKAEDNFHDDRTYGTIVEERFSSCCGGQGTVCESATSLPICESPEASRPDAVIRLACAGITQSKCCDLGHWEDRSWDDSNCEGGICRMNAPDGDLKAKCKAAGGFVETRHDDVRTCGREFSRLVYALDAGYTCDDKVPWGGQHTIRDEFGYKHHEYGDLCCTDMSYFCKTDGTKGEKDSEQVSGCAVAEVTAELWEVRCHDISAEDCCSNRGAWVEEEHWSDQSSVCAGNTGGVSGPTMNAYCRFRREDVGDIFEKVCTDLGGKVDTSHSHHNPCDHLPWEWTMSGGNCSAHVEGEMWPEGKRMQRDMVDAMRWWGSRCCTDGASACQDDDYHSKASQVCADPNDFQAEKVTEVLCHGLTIEDCCSLKGDWRHEGDSGLCSTEYDQRDGYPMRSNVCNLGMWNMENKSIDLVKLCKDKGGSPARQQTCSASAHSFTLFNQGNDCSKPYGSWGTMADGARQLGVERGCCNGKPTMCETSESTASSNTARAAKMCKSPANFKPEVLFSNKCFGISSEDCCRIDGEFREEEEDEQCRGVASPMGSKWFCSYLGQGELCTSAGGTLIQDKTTCLDLDMYVMQRLEAAGIPINATLCEYEWDESFADWRRFGSNGKSLMDVMAKWGCCSDFLSVCSDHKVGSSFSFSSSEQAAMCADPSKFNPEAIYDVDCLGITHEQCCALGGSYEKNGDAERNKCKDPSTWTGSCKLNMKEADKMCQNTGGVVENSLKCRVAADYVLNEFKVLGWGSMGTGMCGKEFINQEFGPDFRYADDVFKYLANFGCCGEEVLDGKVVNGAAQCEDRSPKTFAGTPCMFDKDFQPDAPWTVNCQGMSEERCKEAKGVFDGCSCQFSAEHRASDPTLKPMLDPTWTCESAGPFIAKTTMTCETAYMKYWATFSPPTQLVQYTSEFCSTPVGTQSAEAICEEDLPNLSFGFYSQFMAENSPCCSPDKKKIGRHKCEPTTTTTTPEATVADTQCSKGLPDGDMYDVSNCAQSYLTLNPNCTVSCSENYEGEGKTFTCGEANTFSGTTPSCSEKVCLLSSIPGLASKSLDFSYVHNCGDVTVDGQCIVTCPAGYEYETGDTVMYYTCLADKSFEGWAPPMCRKKKCQVDTLPVAKGTDTSGCESVEVNSTCVLSCKPGFEGESTSPSCNMDLTFSGSAPSCKALPCSGDGLAQPQNTYHTCSEVFLEQKCTMFCDRGYRGTPLDYVCEKSVAGIAFAKVESRDLQCNGIPCTRQVPNGVGLDNSDCDGKKTKENCTLRCVKGYETTDSAESQCGADGAFSSVTGFRCYPKTCSDISSVSGFSFADGVATTCPGRKYKQSCSAFCMRGYELVGDVATLLCDDDSLNAGFIKLPLGSSWGAPNCQAKECTYGIPKSLGIQHNCAGIKTGQTCSASPGDGYEAVGALTTVTLECMADGVLVITDAQGLPAVQPVQCPAPTLDPGVLSNCAGKRVGQSCWYYCDAGYTGDAVPYDCTYSGSAAFTPTASSIACSSRRLAAEEIKTSGARRAQSSGACDASISSVFTGSGIETDCAGKANGEVCIASCMDGYKISGAAKIYTCSSDTFTTSAASPLPVCNAIPCVYDLPDGLGVSSDCSGTGTGSTCTATCSNGYELASGESEQTFTCNANGSFSGTSPSCQPSICTALTPGAAYNASQCDGKTTGESCIVECADGYDGTSMSITCLSNGTFENTLPDCTPRACDNGLPSGAELVVSACSGTTTGGTCSITCAAGYAGEAETFTCMASGAFTGATPQCQPATCPDIPSTATVISDCQGVVLGESCTQSCAPGTIGSAVQRTCEVSGAELKIGGSEPTCQAQRCDSNLPLGSHFSTTSLSACSGLFFGQECSIECATGYEPGTGTLSCLADQSLAGSRPTCVKQVCPAPSMLGMKSDDPCDAVLLGETCTADCQTEGYSRQSGPPRTLTCSVVGDTVQLSGVSVTCVSKPCINNIPSNEEPYTHSCAGSIYGETCEVGCKEGYEGTPEVWTCNLDQSFSGVLPTCTNTEGSTTVTTVLASTTAAKEDDPNETGVSDDDPNEAGGVSDGDPDKNGVSDDAEHFAAVAWPLLAACILH